METPGVGDAGVLDNLVLCKNAVERKLHGETRRRRRWLGSPNPDLLKFLERLHDALREFERLLAAGRIEPPERRARLARVLDEAEPCLRRIRRDGARRLLYDAQMLLLEVADAQLICGLLEVEKHWNKTMTSLLTWDVLYPKSECEAVLVCYRRGDDVPADQLESARHDLISLYMARRDEELAYASRTGLRRQSLTVLFVVLAVILSGFLIAYARAANASAAGTIMLPLAGGLGAALSGTLKTRDLRTRETDLERVRSGLYAQLLVGAVFGVIVVFILQSGLVNFGDITFNAKSVVDNAAAAFVAGFSEPFALRTVERVGRVGGGAPPKRSTD